METAAHPRFLFKPRTFGMMVRDIYIVRFVADGCRKNLPLSAPSMTLDENKYWPFDVLPPSERTPLHNQFIAFLESTHAAGFAPFVSGTESEIGFDGTDTRSVRYVLRGGRGEHWEPWLADNNQSVRLGPLFDLPEHRCVVFICFDDMTKFTLRWLRGETLHESLGDIAIFEKHNTNQPLRLSA